MLRQLRRRPRPRGSCLAALLLCACADEAFHTPHLPPASESPCFDVNLADGLSETDPRELLSLYRCLDAGGGYAELEDVVVAASQMRTRDDVEISREVGALTREALQRVDVVSFLRQASALLREEDAFLLHVVHTFAEWGYGRPWPEVEGAFASGGAHLAGGQAVEGGLLRQLLLTMPTFATLSLDDPRRHEVWAAVAETARRAEVQSALFTLMTLVEADADGLFAHVAPDFALYFGAALAPGGTDTLVDLVRALGRQSPDLQGSTAIVAIQRPVHQLLRDEDLVSDVVAAIGALHADGALMALPAQLAPLCAMDSQGGALDAGEESAFEAALLLLEAADQSVGCGFLSTQSLSRTLLSTVASWDGALVSDLVVLSEELVNAVLGVAELACWGLDDGVRERLPALVRLAESGALEALVPLLAAVDRHPGGTSALVDAVSIFVRGGAADEFSEHARRVLDGPFLSNVFDIIGRFVSPTDPRARADLLDLLALVRFLVEEPPLSGPDATPLALMWRPVGPWIDAENEAISGFLQSWAVLLGTPGAESHGFLHEVAPLLAVDPELQTVDALAELLLHPAFVEPTLRILEHEAFVERLAALEVEGGQGGPIAMLCRFAAEGTGEAALALAVWVADTLDRLNLLPEQE